MGDHKLSKDYLRQHSNTSWAVWAFYLSDNSEDLSEFQLLMDEVVNDLMTHNYALNDILHQHFVDQSLTIEASGPVLHSMPKQYAEASKFKKSFKSKPTYTAYQNRFKDRYGYGLGGRMNTG